jgi:hypothetical protein
MVAELALIVGLLERHAPTITLIDYDEDADAIAVLDDMHPVNLDRVETIATMMLVGKLLAYRVFLLESGNMAVAAWPLDRESNKRHPAEIVLQNEPRARSVAWFLDLLERNRVRVPYLRGMDLRDAHGRVVLSIG